MKYTPWFVRGIVILLIIIVALTSCNKEENEAKITIGEVTRSVFYAPEYVAVAQGFFEEQGLEVDIQTTAGGDKTMAALLAGSVDIALVGAETSIYVYQQGAEDPVINFAQLTQTDGTFLFARNTEGSFDWEQLRDSTFLGQRKGGMPQMAGEFALNKHGIDPQSDLELIQNVDFANIASAFASGTGDYVQLFEPQASIFEQEDRGKVVASFGTESGRLPYTVFMTKQSYLNDNKDIVQKFTNGLHKAQAWVDSHSAEEIAEVISPFFKDIDSAILISSVNRYKEQGSYATDPIIDEEEWNNLLDVMSAAGELKERVDLNAIVDNAYAEEATKSK
ncbi:MULTISPECIES: ABC transporter substrate-binding protein [Paenibacillus]|uniref:ABC transporter substrate-binding protein n=1 Tax=Paenibacillus TaxID=44249 RepID=UPI000B8377B7|nr:MULTISPECIES: ABC transporter substrate-binding protein [Paenibacillus]MBD8836607.1 ABC transporter substrate-binding protein [Paenibacillus sp. CFBP 13594]PRA04907.1 ABC transporter substrate-binding protein [Paenibacillus sp. MYb63]PRA47748.1 ABC transporter substrate-binding protein [Paenibacillus sp. MYb67]QZN74785.1 ABC transporter substrate-binding protein [Paenibacillus sp. DR312]